MNIKEIVGSKRKRQLETRDARLTMTVAHWEALDRMVALSQEGPDGDDSNDMDYLLGQFAEEKADELMLYEEKERIAAEKKRKEDEDKSKVAPMPASGTGPRTRNQQVA